MKMKKTAKKQMTMTQITNTLKKEGFYKSIIGVVIPTMMVGAATHVEYTYFGIGDLGDGFGIKTNSKIDYFIVSTEFENGEFSKSYALYTLKDVLIYSKRVKKEIEIKRENAKIEFEESFKK